MSLFRLPKFQRLASKLGTIRKRNRRGRGSNKGVLDRVNRRLMIDPLEERQLLTVISYTQYEFADNDLQVVPENVEQILVNETYSELQYTVMGKSIAVDNDGDFVVAWTRYEEIYDPSSCGYLTDANIYARYFTDEVQRIMLPEEVGHENFISADLDLAYNGYEVQKICITATNALTTQIEEPVAGTITLEYRGVSDYFNYDETDMVGSAAAMQTALRHIGSVLLTNFGDNDLANAEVRAVSPGEFLVEFMGGKSGLNLPLIEVDHYSPQTIYASGFCPTTKVYPVRDPGNFYGIKIFPDDPYLTAYGIEQHFKYVTQETYDVAPVYFYGSEESTDYNEIEGGPYSVPMELSTPSVDVTVTPVLLEDVPAGAYEYAFDVTFVGNSGKINQPLMDVLDVAVTIDNGGLPKTSHYDTEVNTLKETSAEFRVNAPDKQNDATPWLDFCDQTDAAVAIDADGDFIITWVSDLTNQYGQTGREKDIIARRFSPTGYIDPSDPANITAVETAIADSEYATLVKVDNPNYAYSIPVGLRADDEFTVNSFTTGMQHSPDVSMDDSGNFTIIWTSEGQEHSEYNWIIAKRYDRHGDSLGAEFLVNDNDTRENDYASVAVSNDGHAIVTWTGWDEGIEGDNEIFTNGFAKIYSPQGEVLLQQFSMDDSVLQMTADWDADNNFTIAWHQASGDEDQNDTDSIEEDGDDLTEDGVRAVYYQLYDDSGMLVGQQMREEFRVNSANLGDTQDVTAWPMSQSGPQVGMDADGDLVITYEGYAPDVSNGDIDSQIESELLEWISLQPFVSDVAIGLKRLELEELYSANLLRGEYYGIMYSRWDADQGATELNVLNSDSIINSDRDGRNTRYYIAIPSDATSGGFTVTLSREGTDYEEDVDIEVAYSNTPVYILPDATRESIEEALCGAVSTGHNWATSDEEPGPVVVNILNQSLYTGYWDLGLPLNDYYGNPSSGYIVFEVIFQGESHDVRFNMRLPEDSEDASDMERTISVNPTVEVDTAPWLVEMMTVEYGAMQYNAGMDMEPDGDFVSVWTQAEQYTGNNLYDSYCYAIYAFGADGDFYNGSTTANHNIYYREFDESSDTAGPRLTDLYDSTGTGVGQGETITVDASVSDGVRHIVLTFDEEMLAIDPESNPDSILNPENFALYRNGVEIPLGVANVEFGLSRAADLAGTVETTVVRPEGDNNNFSVTSPVADPALDGSKLVFVDSHTSGDTATATYDAATKTLTVEINPGETTCQKIVNAINTDGTFSAELYNRISVNDSGISGNDGSGVVSDLGNMATLRTLTYDLSSVPSNKWEAVLTLDANGGMVDGVTQLAVGSYTIEVNAPVESDLDDESCTGVRDVNGNPLARAGNYADGYSMSWNFDVDLVNDTDDSTSDTTPQYTNGTTSAETPGAVAADGDGDHVVVWTGHDTTLDVERVYMRLYDADGEAATVPLYDSGGNVIGFTTCPVLEVTPGWNDTTPYGVGLIDQQDNANVAMDKDGDFVVTWTNSRDTTAEFTIEWEGHSQTFAYAGDIATLVLQVKSAFAAWGESVTVDWTSTSNDTKELSVTFDNPGNQENVVITNVEIAGNVSNTANISSTIENGSATTQENAKITLTGFIDGVYEEVDIYACRFDAVGNAQGDAFRVNTYTTDTQQWSDVAMDTDGDFVVTWSSYGQEDNGQNGYGYGVYARQYDSFGQPLASEFQVNVTRAGNQQSSSVAMDSDGNFVVAWTSDQYGSGDDIVAREFNADGSPRQNNMTDGYLDGEIVINDNIAGNQRNPDVAMSLDGSRYVVTWSDSAADLNGYSVWAEVSVPLPTSYGDGMSHAIWQQHSFGITVGDSTVIEDIDVHIWNLVHENLEELYVTLTSPEGTEVVLFSSLPGEFDDNTVPPGNTIYNLTLDDEAPDAVRIFNSVAGAVPPYTGIYAPQENLEAFDGQNAQGTWTLNVWDTSNNGQTGYMSAGGPGEMSWWLDISGQDDNASSFLVNTTRDGHQMYSTVAMDHEGNFIIAWCGNGEEEGEEDKTGHGVFYQRYDKNASRWLGETRANQVTEGNQWLPSIASDAEGNFVLVWTGDTGDARETDIYKLTGTNVAPVPDDVGPIVTDVWYNGERLLSGDFLDVSSNVTEITVAFDEELMNTFVDGGTTPSIHSVTNLNNWVLEKNGSEVPGMISSISFGYNAATRKWEATLTLDGNGLNSGTPALSAGEYTLGIRDAINDVSIYFDPGEDEEDELVNGNSLDGNYDGIPGSDPIQEGFGAYLHHFTVATSETKGAEYLINEETQYEQTLAEICGTGRGLEESTRSVAVDHDGDYVVVWTSYGQDDTSDSQGAGVYMRLYDRNNDPLTGEVLVNTYTEGHQRNASVAMDADGDFVVVWESEGQDPDDSWGIYGQRFDAVGNKVDDVFRVNVERYTGNQLNPAVAMDDYGNFVVAWATAGQDFSFFNDVYIQRYNNRGERLGLAYLVNDTSGAGTGTIAGGFEVNPTVAMVGSTGDFMVAWDQVTEQINGVATDSLIYGRIFNADGTPLPNGPFLASIATGGIFPPEEDSFSARNPQLAADGQGNYILVYESYDVFDDTSGQANYGVQWQYISSSGSLGGMSYVNMPEFVGQQVNPSIAIDADGDFAVVWNGEGGEPAPLNSGDQTLTGDTDLEGVFVRMYNAAREAVDVQTRVNRTEAGIQQFPTIAMEPDGDFIVVWSGRGVNDQHGIFARRYNEATDTAGPLATELRAVSDNSLIDESLSVNSLQQIKVVFDEQMKTHNGWVADGSGTAWSDLTSDQQTNENYRDSVENPANWALLDGEGAQMSNMIESIEFTYNATTNKWEALLTFATELTNDTYTIIALAPEVDTDDGHSGLHDAVGNPLGSSGFLPGGQDISLTFEVAMAADEIRVNPDVDPNDPTVDKADDQVFLDESMSLDVFPNSPQSIAADADGDYVVVWTDTDSTTGDTLQISAAIYDVVWIENAQSKREATYPGPTKIINVFDDMASIPFDVSTATYASVALDGDGDFVVTWTAKSTDGDGSWDVWYRRFDAVGTPVGEANEVSTLRLIDFGEGVTATFDLNWDGHSETLTFDGDASTLATDIHDAFDGWGVEVTVTNVDTGSLDDFRLQIEFTGADGLTDQPEITVKNIEITADPDGNAEMTTQILTETTQQGSADGVFRVNTWTDLDQQFSTAAMDIDGDFVITWQSEGQDGNGTEVYAKRYDRFGNVLDVQNETQVISFINYSTGKFRLAWNGSNAPVNPSDPTDDEYGITYSNALGASNTMDRTNDAIKLTEDVKAAMAELGANVQVRWLNSTDLQIVFIGEEGQTDLPQIEVVPLSISGGYGAQITSGTIRNGASGEFRVNQTTDDDQLFPSIAMDSLGDFVITWTSEGQDGDDEDESNIYARLYHIANTDSGITAGNEFLVNVTTEHIQKWSDVAMDADGDFVITWTSYNEAMGDGERTVGATGEQEVMARRFNSIGNAIYILDQIGDSEADPPTYTLWHSEFLVNSFTNGTQQHSQVAMDADGDFIITWESFQDRSGTGASQSSSPENFGVYAQAYACNDIITRSLSDPQRADLGSSGEIGDETQINATIAGDQRYPGVAMDDTGDYVIVWSGYGMKYDEPTDTYVEDDDQGIYSRQFPVKKDIAGPTVTDVLNVTTDGLDPVTDGAMIYDSVDKFVVIFGEELNTYLGPDGVNGVYGENSVFNPENWQLYYNNILLNNGIYDIEFTLNAATGKYEATITFDSDWTTSGAQALSVGEYELIVKEEVKDIWGNVLDGNYDGESDYEDNFEDDFSISFTIGLANDDDDDPVDPVDPNDPNDDYYTDYNANQEELIPDVDQYLVNETYSELQNMVTGKSIAMDNDGDFVVTWTRYDYVYDEFGNKLDANGNIVDSSSDTPMLEANVYARYFTDEVQRIVLPEEVSGNNSDAGYATFSLAYNGNEVQKIKITATDSPYGQSDSTVAGVITYGFDANGSGTIVFDPDPTKNEIVSVEYDETDMVNSAQLLQDALRSMGGRLADVVVKPVDIGEFEVHFGDASNGLDLDLITIYSATFSSGFYPAAEVSAYRDPGSFDIKVSLENPLWTATAIEQYFSMTTQSQLAAPIYFDGYYGTDPDVAAYYGYDGYLPYYGPIVLSAGMPEVSVTPVCTPDDPQGQRTFDITFINESGKINQPEMKVTQVTYYDKDGVSQDADPAGCVTTIKETSSEFQVNEVEVDNEVTPALEYYDQTHATVAMDADGDFVITWQGEIPDTPGNSGSVTDIFARRFTPTGYSTSEADIAGTELDQLITGGIRTTDQFRVNTFTTGAQSEPDVGIDDDGNFTVVWSSEAQSNSYGNDIWMKRFDRHGEALDEQDVLVSDNDNDNENENVEPAVAVSDDGHILITWNEEWPGYSPIRAKVYDAEGNVLLEQFWLGGEGDGDGGSSSASETSPAWDSNNHFVVAWQHLSLDDMDNDSILEDVDRQSIGVRAQLYELYDESGNLSGELLQDTFRVNSANTGDNSETPEWPLMQSGPTACLDADGDLVITYDGYGPDVMDTNSWYYYDSYGTNDIDSYIEMKLVDAVNEGYSDYQIGLLRAELESWRDLMRGEANGVMFTRWDANYQNGYFNILNSDSIVNADRDGNNMRYMIAFEQVASSGGFTLRLWRDGVSNYEDISISPEFTDDDPATVDEEDTRKAIEEALIEAIRTGDSWMHEWNDDAYDGSVSVRVISDSEIAARRGTAWDLNLDEYTDYYAVEIVFQNESHDSYFWIGLSPDDEPDLQKTIYTGPDQTEEVDAELPIINIMMEADAGTAQYDSSSAMQPDGDFVTTWLQNELYGNDSEGITNIYYRGFDEKTDTAGPLFVDMSDAQGNALSEDSELSGDVRYFVLTFDEEMLAVDPDLNPDSILNINNFVLYRNGEEVEGAVKHVSFGMSRAADLAGKPAFINPTGDNNNFVVEPSALLAEYDGVVVEFVHNAANGDEAIVTYVTYDSVNKKLEIDIDPSATTASTIVDAINNEGTFAAQLSDEGSGNDGSGIVGDLLASDTIKITVDPIDSTLGYDLSSVASNKWEAVLIVEVEDGFTFGEYTITALAPTQDNPDTPDIDEAHSGLRDAVGNPLGYTGYEPDGVEMSRSFMVAAGEGGSETPVDTSGARTYAETPSAVAVDGDGDHIVAWTDHDASTGLDRVYFQVFNDDGSARSGKIEVTPSATDLDFAGDDQRYASVACDEDGDFVVSWTNFRDTTGDGNNNEQDVYARRYNAVGEALGDAFCVNTYTKNNQKYSSVAMDLDGDFVVTWSSYGQEDNGQLGRGYGVYARCYDQFGQPLAPEFQVNITTAGNQMLPSVAMDLSGRFVVAWQSNQSNSGDDIIARVFDADATPWGGSWGGEILVNNTTEGNQRYPDVAMSETGQFVVTWTATEGDGEDNEGTAIYAQRLSTSLLSEYYDQDIPLENRYESEDVGQSISYDEGTVISTIEIAHTYTIADINVEINITHPEPQELVVSLRSPDGTLIELCREVPTSGADGQDFQDTYFDDDVESKVNIQDNSATPPFSAAYVPKEPLNTFDLKNVGGTWELIIQDNYAVQVINEGTIIEDSTDGVLNAWALEITRVSPRSGEFQVNTTTAGDQLYSSVDMDRLGNFTITWCGYGDQKGEDEEDKSQEDTFGVFYQRFSGNNEEIGEETRANTQTTGKQWMPSIGSDGEGNFVIAWTGLGRDASDQIDATTTGVYKYLSNKNVVIVDEASPLVTGIIYTDDNTLEDKVLLEGGVITTDTDYLYVQFDEKLSTKEVLVNGEYVPAVNSVLNLDNWKLERNGIEIVGAISDVMFLFYPPTGKYEAWLALDGNGMDGGTEPLDAGAYTLTLSDLVTDLRGNELTNLSAISGDRETTSGTSAASDDLGGLVFDFYVSDDSSRLGAEFRINDDENVSDQQRLGTSLGIGQAEDESTMSVAVDHDGDFAVVWTSYGQDDPDDSQGAGVYLRLYNGQNDQPVAYTPEILVNEGQTAGHQRNASVAMDADGDLIVVWEAQNEDGTWDVWARRFDAAGNPIVSDTNLDMRIDSRDDDLPFQVNTFEANDQLNPAVSCDDYGNFVVVWASKGQTMSYFNEVHGQMFNYMGEQVGEEFQINESSIPGVSLVAGVSMINPAVAMSGDGTQFVVAWEQNIAQSNGVVTDSNIVARLFNSFGEPLVINGAESSEFQVNSSGNFVSDALHDPHATAGGDESWQRAARNPQIVMDDTGNFIVVWEAYRDNDTEVSAGADSYGIYYRSFDTVGDPLSDDQQANLVVTEPAQDDTLEVPRSSYAFEGDQLNPSIAMDSDGDFAIVWNGNGAEPNPMDQMDPDKVSDHDNSGVFLRQFNANNEYASVQQRVNRTTAGVQEFASIGMTRDGSMVVVWSGNGVGDQHGIFARSYQSQTDTAGPMATELRWQKSQGDYRLVGEGDNIVTWGNQLHTLYVVFDEDMNTAMEADNVTPGEYSVENINNWALVNGRSQEIQGAIESVNFVYNHTLQKWTAEINLSSTAGLENGDYVLYARSDMQDVAGNSLGRSGVRPNGLREDLDGTAAYLPITNPTGGFGFYFRMNDTLPGDAPYGDIDQSVSWSSVTTDNVDDDNDGWITLDNTDIVYYQENSAVARNSNGDYVVVWVSFSETVGSYRDDTVAPEEYTADIVAQRYNSEGRAIGGMILVNSLTSGLQVQPDVAIDDSGNFIVVWAGDGSAIGDESESGIFAKRFDDEGKAVGGQFLVNQYTQDDQDQPTVAMNQNNGDFVITWTSYQRGAGRENVVARKYSWNGVPQTNEFIVNTYTTEMQVSPDVAMNISGDFIITWASDGQDADDWGVYAQRYDSSANRRGGEFRVNTRHEHSQQDPSIAMNNTGDFVIAWESFGQDGSGWGIYAQRYNNSGVAQGGEFRVNSTTQYYQIDPAVAMNNNGVFMITWTSYDQDNPQEEDIDDYGVYARMYNGDGSDFTHSAVGPNPIGEFRVNGWTLGDQYQPAVAAGGNSATGDDCHFIVTWSGQDEVFYLETTVTVENNDETTEVTYMEEIDLPAIHSRLIDPPVQENAELTTLQSVHLVGTSADDLFEFIGGPVSGSWLVKLNGEIIDVGANTGTITFDGGGGNDTVTLVGSLADDSAEVWDDHAVLSSDDYTISVEDVESIRIDGVGGNDVAALHDSDGDDTFTFMPDYSTIVGPGVDIRVDSFEHVTAYAGNGRDTAKLYGSDGDDEFTAYPSYAVMETGNVHGEARGFEYKRGYAVAGGADSATLYDGAGRDTLYATPTFAKLYGDDFYSSAEGFYKVVAIAENEGSDVAILKDSAGDDIFEAKPGWGKLYIANEYYIRTEGFELIQAYGDEGGNNTARLYDSIYDDIFVAGPGFGRLTGAGFSIQVDSFQHVTGYGNAGGYDRAELYDSAGDDNFVATTAYGALYGDGFYNRAYSFEDVKARSTSGGTDTALLYDSALNDYLTANADERTVTLSNEEIEFSYWVWNFTSVEARSSNDGDIKSKETTSVDFLLATGQWELED